MEKLIFCSPKKYKILEIKKLLNENDIPITSIKLYIYVNMTKHDKYSKIIDEREKRDELIVPIEEFNEKLNDAETFEIYIETNYVDRAVDLIGDFTTKNFYSDCIFQSKNYDEAFDIQRMLVKNEIPCDDVMTNFLEDNKEEYLVFLDPEFHEKAHEIIKNSYKQDDVMEQEEIKQNESILFHEHDEWEDPFMKFLKILFVILIIIILIFLVDKNYPFVSKILDLITKFIKQ